MSATVAQVLLTAIVPIIWGTTYLVTTEYLPAGRPLFAAVIRTLPAGILLIVLTRSFLPSVPWGRLLLLSTLNIGAFQALLFIAAYRLPGGIAAIAGALQPLMVLSLAWSVDQMRPAATTIATALIAIAGMSVLLLTPNAQWDAWGIVAALMGSASMAAGTFFSRRWQSKMPLLAFTGWQLALGGILLLPLAIFMEPSITHLSLRNIGGYTYLSFVGTLLAYSLWFRGLAKLSPVAVSALGLLSPLTAVLLGWLVLGEAISPRNLFGMLLVLASVLALQVQMRPRKVRASLAAREVKAA